MNKIDKVTVKTPNAEVEAFVENGSVRMIAPASGAVFVIDSVSSDYTSKAGKMTIKSDSKVLNMNIAGEVSLLEALVAATKKGCELYTLTFDEIEEADKASGFGKVFNITSDCELFGAYKYSK